MGLGNLRGGGRWLLARVVGDRGHEAKAAAGELDNALFNIGVGVRKLVADPLDARVAVLEGAAAKGALKMACAHDLMQQVAERVSMLESETRIRFMGIWQPGFAYEKGSLVTHDGSMWYCLCGTDCTKPGTGEGAGTDCADWQLVVKRGRDARDRR